MVGEVATDVRQHFGVDEARYRVTNETFLLLQLIFDARQIERTVRHGAPPVIVIDYPTTPTRRRLYASANRRYPPHRSPAFAELRRHAHRAWRDHRLAKAGDRSSLAAEWAAASHAHRGESSRQDRRWQPSEGLLEDRHEFGLGIPLEELANLGQQGLALQDALRIRLQ